MELRIADCGLRVEDSEIEKTEIQLQQLEAER
jgi:hypothetical protein